MVQGRCLRPALVRMRSKPVLYFVQAGFQLLHFFFQGLDSCVVVRMFVRFKRMRMLFHELLPQSLAVREAFAADVMTAGPLRTVPAVAGTCALFCAPVCHARAGPQQLDGKAGLPVYLFTGGTIHTHSHVFAITRYVVPRARLISAGVSSSRSSQARSTEGVLRLRSHRQGFQGGQEKPALSSISPVPTPARPQGNR